jgi:hypothetical protein
MERYEVHGREGIVSFVAEALEASGARIIKTPSPDTAPFEYRAATPTGEILDLVCYTFTANKYRQRGRPEDEHRFQIKYGSDFDRYHYLHVADEPHRVTLMLGVHLEERVIVAVDPAMHNPTWFSSSVEFKDEHVEEIHRTGWVGWERSRSEARRKRPMPRVSFQTETLLGLKPDRFLRYVQLERIASGMDPGERLLLIDRLADERSPDVVVAPHPLELELGLSARQILDLIDGAFRLKVAVRGSAAEHHLRDHLATVPGVDEVRHIDQDGMPDFEVVFQGHDFRIECKNVLRRLSAGRIKVDFQKTRASKKDPCSRYYRPEEFEVLAACLHPVTEAWEFRFCSTTKIPPHGRCLGHLSEKVYVEGDPWFDRVEELLSQPS